MSENDQKKSSRTIIGANNYYERDISVGGDFVGGDQTNINYSNVQNTLTQFKTIYDKIDANGNLSPSEKTDLKADVKDIQTEADKGDKADESFLARRLRNILRIAPDIFDVVVATLANPAAGFSIVAAKIAQKVKEEESNR
ncbi:MAG: hypothetical protein KDJ65_02365 [Anaerolineae bacterium]|nr:hypothetical protein [Anaerolineae bacterium]